jgi:hypothetical protein
VLWQGCAVDGQVRHHHRYRALASMLERVDPGNAGKSFAYSSVKPVQSDLPR